MSLDRATIITLGSALPPAIGVFGRLESLLKKPDTGLDEIVELVRIDPALTFQITRLANSVFYGQRQQCESLDEAVARVGFRDIHSLVGLVAARQACQHDLSAYQIAAPRFWENAIGNGLIMAALAEQNGTDARGAYSTGLLRNLGRIILNNHAGAVRYPGELVAPDLVAWEQATYQHTAADVGALLLEHWRFSDTTVSAVRFHPNPTLAVEPRAAAMLHLAAGTVADWGYGLPGEQGLWQKDAAMLGRAEVTAAGFSSAIAAAQENYRRVAGLTWAEAA